MISGYVYPKFVVERELSDVYKVPVVLEVKGVSGVEPAIVSN